MVRQSNQAHELPLFLNQELNRGSGQRICDPKEIGERSHPWMRLFDASALSATVLVKAALSYACEPLFHRAWRCIVHGLARIGKKWIADRY
jgi:hypothetical protein